MITGPTLVSILIALLLGGGLTVFVLSQRNRRLVRELDAAHHMRALALDGEATLVRRLRLAAHDVRGVGMTLNGHADHLAAAGHADAAGIAGGAADLLDLADDLQDLTMDSSSPRVLREETIALGAVVDEAIAAVSSTILPGRRNWRVQPDLRPVHVRVDRRAIRHAITRILADAVRGTRHEDWIDIGGQLVGEEFSLSIADEGKGGLTPEALAMRQDSRGIGLRLALARALVEAHGGRMEVEAFAGVGSKVSLVFPGARLAGGPEARATPRSRSYAGPAPAAGSAGQ